MLSPGRNTKRVRGGSIKKFLGQAKPRDAAPEVGRGSREKLKVTLERGE